MAKQIKVNAEQYEEIRKVSLASSKNSSELQQTNARIWFHNNSKKKNSLLLNEISGIPETVPMYQSIGRMFLLTPAVKLKENIKLKTEEDEKELNTLNTKKIYLEKQKENYEKAVKEIINQLEKQ
ncbi:MAG: hypothetical protein EZS28_009130 [Streblomastix strix]|uniref:Prefoldin subunit 1 n=1 Tax=Streblomastix strix TaxID=222440 RepID=A0A5J4WK75_9EUKA|nr:MAG: hypothetical protein EZS28_009130 [Streblomastix strix]